MIISFQLPGQRAPLGGISERMNLVFASILPPCAHHQDSQVRWTPGVALAGCGLRGQPAAWGAWGGRSLFPTSCLLNWWEVTAAVYLFLSSGCEQGCDWLIFGTPVGSGGRVTDEGGGG